MKASDRRWPSETWRLRASDVSDDWSARSVMRSWRAALGAIVAIAPDQAAKIQLFCKKCGKTDGGKFDK